MTQRNVLLTPSQQKEIDIKIKNAKFTRLVDGLLLDRKIDADTKAKLILQIKKKIFEVKKVSRF